MSDIDYSDRAIALRIRQVSQLRKLCLSLGNAKLKELHSMKCPKCGMDLHTIELHGVGVDRCAACMGTWFDNGEVEQMLHPDHQGCSSV